MYNIAICDDNPAFLKNLKNEIIRCNEYDSTMQIDLYVSGKDMLAADFEKYSLAIIDIKMDGLDGMATARTLREKNADILLAFCSGVISPQPEHFVAQPYRYIVKSLDVHKMRDVIGELLKEMKRRSYREMVEVVNNGLSTKVYVDDIIYFTRRKHGSVLTVADDPPLKKSTGYRELLSNEKPEEWYEQLCTSGFEFVHKSYLVNMKYVISIVGDTIEMINGDTLKISRTCKTEFTERCAYYFSKKYKKG